MEISDSKIALAMIVKDTEPLDYMARCLYSVAPHVEGIYLTLNGKKKTMTKDAKDLKKKLEVLCAQRGYPDPVIDYIQWHKDFAEARNHNFAQVPQDKYPWIVWLDADDLLRGGDKMKQVLAKAEKINAASVFFNYLYKVELDEDLRIKSILIQHLRERLVKNDGSFKWVAPIHETLIPQRDIVQTDSYDCDVVHMSTDERMDDAIRRNIDHLEKQLEGQGEQQDPRTLYYLGKSYFDLHEPEYYEKSTDLIYKYLNGSETNTASGWAEERSQAWGYLTEMYRMKQMFNSAIKCAANGIIENPQSPAMFVQMALNYLFMKDWEKAKFWVQLAAQVPEKRSTLVVNPKDLQLRTLEVLYHCAVHTNDLEGAHATAVKLLELMPGDPMMEDRVKMTAMYQEHNELAKHTIHIAKHLLDTGQRHKAQLLAQAIPDAIASEPMLVGMRNDLVPPRTWENDEITIICGRGFEKWSPKNIDQGIGGSEEAVIYLSRELSKLGWRVTVYGDPQEDKGVYDGVNYRPYFEFNIKDTFNILVGWRNVALYDHPIKARRAYVWLHDIQNPNEYKDNRVYRLDKIFALSKWHRDNMPNVPDEKFMITANGLNMGHLETIEAEGHVNEPHRVFYGSSYDRGLEHLLKIWPDVRKEVPDAELHVCYGWNLFESFYANNPERMAWKAKIDKMMEADGVVHHGRIGQLDVLREQAKAGIWAYPTHFGEISCITAMKSQALGAIPVVCDYAALKETVQYGVKVDVDEDDIYDPDKREEFKQELIKLLKNEKRQEEIRKEMVPWAKNRFGWEKVAAQWDGEFREDKLKAAMDVVISHNPELEKYLPVQLQEEYGKEQTY